MLKGAYRVREVLYDPQACFWGVIVDIRGFQGWFRTISRGLRGTSGVFRETQGVSWRFTSVSVDRKGIQEVFERCRSGAQGLFRDVQRCFKGLRGFTVSQRHFWRLKGFQEVSGNRRDAS